MTEGKEGSQYELGLGGIDRFGVDEHEQAIAKVESSARDRLLHQSIALVAITGGSATGKTAYFTPCLASRFNDVEVLSEDDYCLGNSRSPKIDGVPNLQLPEAYDPSKIREHLEQLKDGASIEAPKYAYDVRERQAETRTVNPAELVVMEGCYLLQPAVKDLFDVRLFIDVDDHGRFMRRILRPRRNPMQTDASRIREYCEMFYPGYYSQILPYAEDADIIVENPFNPDEAVTVLDAAQNSAIAAPRINSSWQQYMHQFMSDSEYLGVGITADGVQELRYHPEIENRDIGITFEIPLGEYPIDLTRIGYDKV